MGAGASAQAGAFDEVPESNSPPRERQRGFDAKAGAAPGGGRPDCAGPQGQSDNGPVSKRERGQRLGKRWWREMPPKAFTISVELDDLLDHIQSQSEALDESSASATVVRLADSLGIPVAKRDEWSQDSEIPPVVRFRRLTTSKTNYKANKGTTISSLCENLRLLESGSPTPAATRALLKTTVMKLLGKDTELSGDMLKSYCRKTRVRVFRMAAYDIGLIEDALCLSIRDNERFQEEYGPLIKIIESGEKLDPSAKRAIIRAILRDAKSPKQVTSPVKRAAEEVGASVSFSPKTFDKKTSAEIRLTAASLANGPEEDDAESGLARDHLVRTHTLIALLACLEDVGRLTPTEIRALLANLFSIISTGADLEDFVDFILNTRIRSVWKAALQSGLVRWNTSLGQYSFMHSVLGTSDVGILLSNE